MAIYTGHTGRVSIIGPGSRQYNLIAHKYVLTTKTQEEDVTTAQDTAAAAGRLFTASLLPRIDVQVEGFWTSLNNPFGNPSPLQVGFDYGFFLYLDKGNPTPNVEGQLLVLGCEVTGSIRDAVRYVLSGVMQGAMVVPDVAFFPDLLPTFFPLQ